MGLLPPAGYGVSGSRGLVGAGGPGRDKFSSREICDGTFSHCCGATVCTTRPSVPARRTPSMRIGSPDPLFKPLGKRLCPEHLDYRLKNMRIDSSGTRPRVSFVNWQSVRLDKPLNDAACRPPPGRSTAGRGIMAQRPCCAEGLPGSTAISTRRPALPC